MKKEERDLAIYYWELRKKIQPKIRQKRKASYSPWMKERSHTRREDSYHERQTQIGLDKRTSNHVCCECRKTFKILGESIYNERPFPKCPNCGSEKFYDVGILARVPRKNASNAVWKKFEFLFIDSQGFFPRDQKDAYRKKTQEAIDKE